MGATPPCVAVLLLIELVLAVLPLNPSLSTMTMETWLRSRTIEAPLVVSCVGDSITKGSGATNINRTAYPAQLQRLLGKGRFTVRNYGVGGSTVLTKTSMPYWNTYLYAESLASQPDIVVAMWGTNDAKSLNWDEKKYEKDYLSMLRSYQELPTRPLTFVMVSPPLYMARHEIQWDMQPTVVNTKLPRAIRRVAAASGSVLIDVFAAMGGAILTRPELFVNKSRPHDKNDGCHPNDMGYRAMARVVAEAFHAHLPTSVFGEEEVEAEEEGEGAQQDVETGQEQLTEAVKHDETHSGGGIRRRVSSSGSGSRGGSSSSSSSSSSLGRRRQVVVTCVGDSLTEGLGASRLNGSYPSHLQRLLSASPALADARVVVFNYGVRGTTALRASPRAYWHTHQHRLALQSNPNAVVLMFGTNDASISLWNETAFVADYAALAQTYAQLSSSPSVLLATPPPVYFRSKYPEEEDVRARLPAVVARVAGSAAAAVLPLHEALGGHNKTRREYFFGYPAGLKNDGLHCNDAGYRAMGHAVAPAVVHVLKETLSHIRV